ncbi:FtsB family cell division protein [Quadrisphaera oryzae]|uniref:FtsB family cell division protein n=1 Tax=Quadrisphaera TaxID=317661 RepID=UPI0016481EE9|nr:hypothetical protein [Quadrisphaera sp. RL12-1S]MBC3763913.1 hypothetical protein [Quadrisphaera sp. RL12-1S]
MTPSTGTTTTTTTTAAQREGGRVPHAPRPPRGVRRPVARAARPAARTGTRAATRAAAPLAPRAGRGRARTVVLCGAVLVASLLVALWTNIALSGGSYAEQRLQAQQTQLAEQEQALTEHLQQVSSPGAVDQRARQLGLVKAPRRAWLVLQAPQPQAVVGSPTAAPTPTPSDPSADPSSTDGSSTATSTPSSSAAAAEQGALDTDGSATDPSAGTPTATATPTGPAASAPAGPSAGAAASARTRSGAAPTASTTAGRTP